MPPCFSRQSIVTGKVAAEELVENAVISAGDTARNTDMGLTFAINFKYRGKMIRLKMASPPSTVAENSAREDREERPVVEATLATRQKTPTGSAFMMMWVIEIIVSNNP